MLLAIVAAAMVMNAQRGAGQTTSAGAVGQPAALPAIDAAAAAQRLALRGLTPAGRHWLCVEDVRLRRQLDGLDRNQKQFHQARKILDQKIEENQRAGRSLAEVSQKIAQQQQLLNSTNGAAARRQLAEEITRLQVAEAGLRMRYLPPEQFAEDAALRGTLIEWINARNALAVAALGHQATLYRISGHYEALRRDAEIKQMLPLVGERNVLGGGRNFAAAAGAIADAKRVALAADAPLYRVAGQWRTSLLIEDSTPAACTVAEQGPMLILPETVAHAAGLAAGMNLPGRRFTAADGRQFDVQVVQLKRIRLGSQEIAKVEAYILPPEAEDLGVVLNRQYLGAYRIELQPNRLRLVLRRGA